MGGNVMEKGIESRNEVLKVLAEHGELSTPEVAELTGLKESLARYYLKALAFEGRVAWRRLGKRVLMWSLKKEG